MKKSILVLPEFQLRHIFWLLEGLVDISDESDIDIFWTHTRWCPPDFIDFPGRLEHHAMPYDVALSRLADGGFDAVVFSDGTTAGYMAKNIKNTVKVYLDSADFGHVLSPILSFADLYLKCQHPSGVLYQGDSIVLEPYSGSTPVVPWPYCPNQRLNPEWWSDIVPMSKKQVFFHGWAWPKARIEAVQAVVNAEIPFCGGFYRREEVPVIQPIPFGLEADRMSFPSYCKQMVESQIVLNAVGNGQMCFRCVEAMSAGCCIVSAPVDVAFPGRAPRSGVEWMQCSIDEIPEVCRWLLDNPDRCAEIGRAAQKYYNDFLTPRYAANRLIQLLGWSNL